MVRVGVQTCTFLHGACRLQSLHDVSCCMAAGASAAVLDFNNSTNPLVDGVQVRLVGHTAYNAGSSLVCEAVYISVDSAGVHDCTRVISVRIQLQGWSILSGM